MAEERLHERQIFIHWDAKDRTTDKVAYLLTLFRKKIVTHTFFSPNMAQPSDRRGQCPPKGTDVSAFGHAIANIQLSQKFQRYALMVVRSKISWQSVAWLRYKSPNYPDNIVEMWTFTVSSQETRTTSIPTTELLVPTGRSLFQKMF